MSDDNYIGILMEEIRDQNKAVLEIVNSMKEAVAQIPAIKEDLYELKQDMKVVKAVVKDTNLQVQSHERRITALETA